MDKKAIFQQIIRDFSSKPLEGIYPREIEILLDSPKIISLLGPRRSGKTHILFHLILRLRQEVPIDRIVYINFEDDRLFPLQLQDMDALVRGYYEMYPQNKEHKVYFFLDEIQEIADWEKFIRRLFDQEDCQIFLTGSSSRLLSREIASSLRGRTLPYEVFPLNFREFLQFNRIEVDPFSSKGQAFLLHWLRRYLKQGGFPELPFLPEHLHNRVANEYIDLMLYRDLSERFGLKNPHLIKYLLKYLLNNISNLLSVNKAYNDLKSQGLQIGKNTVYDYISYLEEAFIIFQVEIWSRSVRKQAVNPSKIYGIDSAFKYAMSITEDFGRVMENAVFLELRRQGKFPNYYFSQQKEVDFFVDSKLLFNVCYQFDDLKTRQRELSGLIEAMAFFNLPESYLLTWDKQEDIRVGDKTILVRPLWQFLFSGF